MKRYPSFRTSIRPQQMTLDGRAGTLGRRRREKTGRLSEALLGGELLTTAEAAAYMRISPYTLGYWRTRSKPRCGPPYLKVHAHAVRYRLCDLEAYLESRLVDPARETQRRK